MRKLTKQEWREVFRARCRSKNGTDTQEDRVLCETAFNEDRERYEAMSKDVFNATVPFGSDVRLK